MKCKKGFKFKDGKCMKEEMKTKLTFKGWWKEHWDEVIFIASIIASMYFILRGTGYF